MYRNQSVFSVFFMMTSSPAQRPVTRSFDVFFDLRLNKRFSKQSWGWWFEMLSSLLWRQCNIITYLLILNTRQLGSGPISSDKLIETCLTVYIKHVSDTMSSWVRYHIHKEDIVKSVTMQGVYISFRVISYPSIEIFFYILIISMFTIRCGFNCNSWTKAWW